MAETYGRITGTACRRWVHAAFGSALTGDGTIMASLWMAPTHIDAAVAAAYTLSVAKPSGLKGVESKYIKGTSSTLNISECKGSYPEVRQRKATGNRAHPTTSVFAFAVKPRSKGEAAMQPS